MALLKKSKPSVAAASTTEEPHELQQAALQDGEGDGDRPGCAFDGDMDGHEAMWAAAVEHGKTMMDSSKFYSARLHGEVMLDSL